MMTGKARLFKNHRAAKLIMSSPDQSDTNASVEACANFDFAAWDREKQHAVLSGKYARFTHNPAMKHHLLSTGNKRLAEANRMDPVWGIGLRADDPRACLLYTSPSPRDKRQSRMPSSA